MWIIRTIVLKLSVVDCHYVSIYILIYNLIYNLFLCSSFKFKMIFWKYVQIVERKVYHYVYFSWEIFKINCQFFRQFFLTIKKILNSDIAAQGRCFNIIRICGMESLTSWKIWFPSKKVCEFFFYFYGTIYKCIVFFSQKPYKFRHQLKLHMKGWRILSSLSTNRSLMVFSGTIIWLSFECQVSFSNDLALLCF